MSSKRKIFYTSDIHFDDPRLNLYGRDLVFPNVDEFDNHIIDRWNSVVGKDDLVIVVGDVAMSRKGLNYMDSLNGEKWLIKGNYDVSSELGGTAKFEISDEILHQYFTKVMDDYVVFINEEPIYINHYPTKAREGVFNIVGHIHGLWKVQRNMINVSLDAWHFTPVSEDLIKFNINAIQKYYDQNVYAGELLTNINSRRGQVKVLRAPEYNKASTLNGEKDIVVFLAGPIQGAVNWQEDMIETLQADLKQRNIPENVIICSPRRPVLKKDFDYEEQYRWECDHLELAGKNGIIVFYLPLEEEHVEGRSYAQTTRFELGEWYGRSQSNPDIKIAVGIQYGFKGERYIINKFREKHSLNFSLKSLTDHVFDMIIKF